MSSSWAIGALVAVALVTVGQFVETAHAQSDSGFDPPKAAYGSLNILRVNTPGLFPEANSALRAQYADSQIIGDDSGEARRGEISRIEISGIRAQRLGATLVIELRDRTLLKFFDDGLCAGFETCQRYTFLEYNAEHDYAVVDLANGAGWEKIMVWLRTGHCTLLPGLPVWSPSGGRFLSIGVVGPGGWDAKVVEMTAAGPKVNAVSDWTTGGVCTVENWVNDELIHVNCGGSRRDIVELVDGTWSFRR